MAQEKQSAPRKHSCEKSLAKDKSRLVRLSDQTAQDGDLWKCSCGKVWVHVCDEAEGCYWTILAKAAREGRE
jgi:hypothetical protein